MKSLLQTGPNLVVKIRHEDGQERTIGFAQALQYQVFNGQKEIVVVDSPFPVEIAQSAGQVGVKGTMSLFLPKGTSMESCGLVPYRQYGDQNWLGATKYLDIRVYDRFSGEVVIALQFCKFGQYSVDMSARSVVKVNAQFSGIFAVTASELT